MLNRRNFLTAASGLIFGSMATEQLLADPTKTIYAGWIPNKRATAKFKRETRVPFFKQAGRHLAGSGAGKKALLWKYFEKVTGDELVPHRQGIGDCVSHGWGLGVDILDTVQAAHGKGEWQRKCATEAIYAGGRVNVANYRYMGDGMNGVEAAKWCREYGILLRQPYLDGKYDFTDYSGSKARKWAHKCNRCTDWGGGVPDELVPIAKKHQVKTTTLVTSWEEARDALFNGYPVSICSGYGFSSRRDNEGFASRQGSWAHCMLLAGMDDEHERSGGLIINSWGKWNEGPTRHDQPVGSFWADTRTIDGMLRQQDSFALSNYVGYPKQNLDYRLY